MKISCPRYLVSFRTKELPHFFTDVLIIGGGLAGLRAALAVDPSLNVLVVSKAEELTISNSAQAQGGIASVLAPSDLFSEHVHDTLVAGGVLCDEAVVKRVISEGPKRVAEMIQWGAEFDRKDDGSLDLGREGGHGKNRIAHAYGDATGREMVRAIAARAKSMPNIRIWTGTYTLDLLTDEGRCVGALVDNSRYGRMVLWAKQTILATGGAGQIYRETTNSSIATGDGMALALRAGAMLRDMEYMQFHPTVLYVAGSSRNLITEAMRGEGAWLLDKNGYRFMQDYDPRGELAPRDVVSRAIISQMIKTNAVNVYLTLTHRDPDTIRARFPGIADKCAQFGIDITKDPIPVRPGAHYMMGGIVVDQDGRTTVPGLWGAGEVTNSGLHGANRLASNSLLEALVYGAAAGEYASEAAMHTPDNLRVIPLECNLERSTHSALDLDDIQNSLKSLMWRNAAVQRSGEGLAEGLDMLNRWRSYVLLWQFNHPVGWELQNMLLVSSMLMIAALEREETRGCHVRLDFPNPDDEHWQRHITFERSE